MIKRNSISIALLVAIFTTPVSAAWTGFTTINSVTTNYAGNTIYSLVDKNNAIADNNPGRCDYRSFMIQQDEPGAQIKKQRIDRYFESQTKIRLTVAWTCYSDGRYKKASSVQAIPTQ